MLHSVHGEAVSGLDLAEDLLDLGQGLVAEVAVLKCGQDVLELGCLLRGGSISSLGGAVFVSQFLQNRLELVHGTQVTQDVRHPAQGTVVDPGKYFVDCVSCQVDLGSGFGVTVVPGTSFRLQEHRQEAGMELSLLVLFLDTLWMLWSFKAFHGVGQRRCEQNLKQFCNSEG